MKKYSAYVITKPLQYINASNIDDYLEKDLYIVIWFDNHEWFIDNVVYLSNLWSHIYICESRNQALNMIYKRRRNYSNVYVDSDYGILLNLYFLLLLPIDVNTYEEGWASYDYISYKRSSLNLYRFALSKLFFHYKNFIGGSFFVNKIILYNPSLFKQNILNCSGKEIVPFKNSFIDHINILKELAPYWDRININMFADKNIIIFITSWPSISIQKFEKISDLYETYFSIIKLHPHFVSGNSALEQKFDFVLERDIPIEFFLSKLAIIAHDVVIVHENSSSIMYFKNTKFKFYNISDYPVSFL